MPDKKNFVLRLEHVSYKALEKWASDEFRSVNGQIEFILNQALKEQFGKHYQERFRSAEKTKAMGKETDSGLVPDMDNSDSPVT